MDQSRGAEEQRSKRAWLNMEQKIRRSDEQRSRGAEDQRSNGPEQRSRGVEK
jgi:hypothetical protein